MLRCAGALWVRTIPSLLAAFLTSPSVWAFNITTHHYNALRTGWNKHETILTPSNLASSTFGMVASAELDEQVDAQPLVMRQQSIAGQGAHNTVVYVATENNTIYAIDGDSGAILLQRNLGMPVSSTNCQNNSAVIGIGATPVIDPSTGILYVIADTQENGVPTFRLYALKLHDLTDAIPSIIVKASHSLSDGSSYKFNATVSRSRAALLLTNGNVYAGFSSYCDFNGGQTRGWLLGWNASTLTPLSDKWLTVREATSPNNFFLTSIWMSGSGIASDGSSVYFVTGNSDPSGTTRNRPRNLTESVVKVSPNLTTLQSAFTPDNYSSLDQTDNDLGSGGIMLLPDQPGSIPALATALGKDGNLYLMNRTALGGFRANTNAVLGVFRVGSCFCGESYFTGSDGINRVVTSGIYKLQTWQVRTSPSPTLVADSWTHNTTTGQDPGFFTTVSSNGHTNGIIWAVGRPDGSNNNAVYLDAVDANTGKTLVSNMIAGYWPNTQANANIVAVVTNGKVYIASFRQLSIFGLTSGGAARVSIDSMGTRQLDSQPDLNRVTGRVKNRSNSKIVLLTRAGTHVTVDATEAIEAQQNSISGDALTAIGQYHADGTLFAKSISRAKSNPALWLPDR
jgi:hypothetical protein